MKTVLDKTTFASLVKNLEHCKRIWIGFSGGADSTALLYLFCSWIKSIPQSPLISALHIHHGLHKEADAWAVHCRTVCSGLDIEYHEQRIAVRQVAGNSKEEIARKMRYATIAGLLADEEVFCTAHHGDDQAETVLLQLLRGSGPEGLAAMPVWRRLGVGWLHRPLLNVTKEAITNYLKRYPMVRIVHDPSNVDQALARAFVRHRLVPLLKQRYQGITKALVRSARLQQTAAEALKARAAEDLMVVRTPGQNALSCDALATLPRPRASAVIRLWIKLEGHPYPRSEQLNTWLESALLAGPDREPLMQLSTIEVRRYRRYLYLVNPLSESATKALRVKHWLWTPPVQLFLPTGILCAVYTKGPGLLHANLANQTLCVRFRQGGERLKLSMESKTRPLKDLWQKYAVPPWERYCMPLVYRDKQLIAVAGLGVASCVANQEHQFGWKLLWKKDEKHC